MFNKLIIGSYFILIFLFFSQTSFAMLALSQAENQLIDDPIKVANDNKPVRVYNTIRLSRSKPKIDWILNDSCWQTGE